MKMPDPHIVPLSRQSLDVLAPLRALNGQHRFEFHSVLSLTASSRLLIGTLNQQHPPAFEPTSDRQEPVLSTNITRDPA
ncbi:hypothetical protein [Burkholderia catarinensis]|uniref:hypothetical protein n=1 Tax=Burkholderia catarinensis TaxID=1108140 RepID=UPI0010082EFB|nr:hypothetical protein [Burkholderia catarinensis]KAG8152166.1 hypothetical protein BFF94_018390 [Burkholderia catarinensis]